MIYIALCIIFSIMAYGEVSTREISCLNSPIVGMSRAFPQHILRLGVPSQCLKSSLATRITQKYIWNLSPGRTGLVHCNSKQRSVNLWYSCNNKNYQYLGVIWMASTISDAGSWFRVPSAAYVGVGGVECRRRRVLNCSFAAFSTGG